MTAAAQTIESGHHDVVHDVQMDYYGKRLATCSSDRTIKVFSVTGDQHTHLADLTGERFSWRSSAKTGWLSQCVATLFLGVYISELISSRRLYFLDQDSNHKEAGEISYDLGKLQRLLFDLHSGITGFRRCTTWKGKQGRRFVKSSPVALLYRKLRHGRGPGHRC